MTRRNLLKGILGSIVLSTIPNTVKSVTPILPPRPLGLYEQLKMGNSIPYTYGSLSIEKIEEVANALQHCRDNYKKHQSIKFKL